MRRGVAALAAVAALLTGCSEEPSGPDLEVGAAYMPQPLAGDMAAGFLKVSNAGGTDDVLTAASSDLAEQVTLHETVGQSMRQADRLTVPARGSLALESGGSHLMFEGLRRKPKQGETVALRLTFDKSGTVTVRLPVKSATYRPQGR